MEWFPHYIDDYDGDTSDLTAAQDGVYHRLLRWYYKNEKPLLNTDRALAKIAGVDMAEWLEMAPIIRAFFVTRDNPVTGTSILLHKRCNAVITAQNKKRRDGKSRQEKLRKNGVLEVVTRDKRVVNAPRVRVEEEVDKTQSVDRPSPTTETEHVESLAQGGKKTAKAVKDALQLKIDESFEPFWSVYPRKIAKPRARKAYVAALLKTDPQTILTGATRYAAERAGQDPGYTAHPATWLNQERWADEHSAASGSHGGQQPQGHNGRAGAIAAGFRLLADHDRLADAVRQRRPEEGPERDNPQAGSEPARPKPCAIVIENEPDAA